jgi:hypothetical protein
MILRCSGGWGYIIRLKAEVVVNSGAEGALDALDLTKGDGWRELMIDDDIKVILL